MTKNQIELIKLREQERANREKENLEKRSQNIDAATSLAGSAFRGLGSTLLGNIMRKPNVTNIEKHYHIRKERKERGGRKDEQ